MAALGGEKSSMVLEEAIAGTTNFSSRLWGTSWSPTTAVGTTAVGIIGWEGKQVEV
jgi:hypothetical protein